MTHLDAPEASDDLYHARGEVTIALPIMQGDVYEGIVVPGLADEPTTVAIVMHPCSMRAGANLRQKITVAAVKPYQLLRDEDWHTGHVNVMPLPALRQNADGYAIDFRDVAAVPSSVLSLRSRIAACSQQASCSSSSATRST